MSRIKLQATTEVRQEVKLSPSARKMLLDRMREHGQLAIKAAEINGKETKKRPAGRMRRIADEVRDIIRREKQGKAFLDGITIEGESMTLVIGKTQKFDQLGFMKKHGLTQEDFDEFTETTDNEPYVKFTHPGQEE